MPSQILKQKPDCSRFVRKTIKYDKLPSMKKCCQNCGMLIDIELSKLFKRFFFRTPATCPFCQSSLIVGKINWIITLAGFAIFILGVMLKTSSENISLSGISLSAMLYWAGFIVFILGLRNLKFVNYRK